jgi:hypothetical protein
MTIWIIPDKKSLHQEVAKYTVTENLPVHLTKISDLIGRVKVLEKLSGYLFYKECSFLGNVDFS